ncbi:delta-class carbonic anhydrase [Microbulbifer sp. S227A]|uniref:delta-class carbonic anhydrase n=1 Tax=Microbulbifer sp. S227A TaxID=3415131 RepID=UPI003C7C3831
MIDAQNDLLIINTEGKGYGPQGPRHIEKTEGNNKRIFSEAPPYEKMNLCNIHFHEAAEHKGGEFTKYAGNGDGLGFGTGWEYSGELSDEEKTPVNYFICPGNNGSLEVGDTIEVHFVHSTAQVTPGPTLGACLSESIINPQLRVEAQVYVIVNDDAAGADFEQQMYVDEVNGYWQAPNIPNDTGDAVQYEGSTTGPSYNTKGSPVQISWSVRPEVKKVTAESVNNWCGNNVFYEFEAQGVRNLVKARELLSEIN